MSFQLWESESESYEGTDSEDYDSEDFNVDIVYAMEERLKPRKLPHRFTFVRAKSMCSKITHCPGT